MRQSDGIDGFRCFRAFLYICNKREPWGFFSYIVVFFVVVSLLYEKETFFFFLQYSCSEYFSFKKSQLRSYSEYNT